MSVMTVEQSLSFDTIIKQHDTLAAAQSYMQRVLLEEGWPRAAAAKAADECRPVLVVDNGDDHTIEIRA